MITNVKLIIIMEIMMIMIFKMIIMILLITTTIIIMTVTERGWEQLNGRELYSRVYCGGQMRDEGPLPGRRGRRWRARPSSAPASPCSVVPAAVLLGLPWSA